LTTILAVVRVNIKAVRLKVKPSGAVQCRDWLEEPADSTRRVFSLFDDATSSVIKITSASRGHGYEASVEIQPRRLQMAALVRALSRATVTQVDIETLKTLAMFCGVGLTVSLMVASYGVDLSAGFF
jgi:hypothetical protein